jgi:hypothetical protein
MVRLARRLLYLRPRHDDLHQFVSVNRRTTTMSRYWVVGGEYKTTDFRDMANGKGPQRFGPFASYEQARVVWQTQSWATVDSCHHRFTIVKEEDTQSDGARGDKSAA